MKPSVAGGPLSVALGHSQPGAQARRTLNSESRVRNPENGVSLILVMLSLMVLSVLAAAIVFTARTETLASYNWKLDTQADYLAKAGIQYGLNWLRSSRYSAVSPITTACGTPPTCPSGAACNYYQLTCSGGTYNTFNANNSPVQCVGTSNCSANQPVALISIPNSTVATNYPTDAAGASNVISNFSSDFPSSGVLISGSGTDKGVVYVNMVLLNYQTVQSGAPPTLNPVAMETWQITSRAYWTGAATAIGTYPIAVAEEQAVVQPIYNPTWGNAMYGYCSASMGGSSGTCTDAFNSALGCYDTLSGCSNTTAANTCNYSSTTNVIDAGAGIGANGYVSLGSNVSVGGNVTLGSGPQGGSACCTLNAAGTACATQFTGSTTGVQGEVVAGPNVPVPPPPTVPTNSASWPSLSTYPTIYPTPGTPPALCNAPTLTPVTTGGSLGPSSGSAWYFYTVTALGSWGESSAGEQAVQLTGTTNQVTVAWAPVTGATAYRVYRGTSSGAENTYFSSALTTFTDNGTGGTATTSPPTGVAVWPQVMPPVSLTLQSGGSLVNNAKYCYIVTAIGHNTGNYGESAGGERCVTAGSGKRQVYLSWTGYPYDTVSNGYNIYRTAADGAPGTELYLGSTTLTNYTDSGGATVAGKTPPANRWAGFPNGTGANPPYFGCTSAPCAVGDVCDGTSAHPFEFNISGNMNSPYLMLLGGKDIFHPVYYDILNFSESGNGSLVISGYVVLNIGGPTSPPGSCSTPGTGTLSITGNGTGNPTDYQALTGLIVNVPPETMQINYSGSSATLGGNGAISAVVTAPCATVTLHGGGSGGYMIGAVRAANVSMQGGYPLHYDVQLSKAGGVVGTMATSAYSRRKF